MGKRRAQPTLVLSASFRESPIEKVYSAGLSIARRCAVVAAAASVLSLIVGHGSLYQYCASGQSPCYGFATPANAESTAALSDAEEAYLRALWPIHGDVERSAVRVSLGTIFYKTGDLERAELKHRIEGALAAYQRAEARISELKPPPAFVHAHEEYLAAIHLYEQGAIEALKMFTDGDDAHLTLAHPLSHEGSNKIREIGGRFWRDEFPPN
jgi:hypothetical protein